MEELRKQKEYEEMFEKPRALRNKKAKSTTVRKRIKNVNAIDKILIPRSNGH